MDADKIGEVLANLVGNAVKFTVSGGVSVSTAVSADGALVEVRVRDTGPGLRREDLPKLFCRFTRLGIANNV